MRVFARQLEPACFTLNWRNLWEERDPVAEDGRFSISG